MPSRAMTRAVHENLGYLAQAYIRRHSFLDFGFLSRSTPHGFVGISCILPLHRFALCRMAQASLLLAPWRRSTSLDTSAVAAHIESAIASGAQWCVLASSPLLCRDVAGSKAIVAVAPGVEAAIDTGPAQHLRTANGQDLHRLPALRHRCESGCTSTRQTHKQNNRRKSPNAIRMM